MRRKPGALVPSEQAILDAIAGLHAAGHADVYGTLVASAMDQGKPLWKASNYGTLYRALERLEDMGRLESHWEQFNGPVRPKRPARHLYRITEARRSPPSPGGA